MKNTTRDFLSFQDAIAAIPRVLFSLSHHAEADPAFGIKKGWNVQRTKVNWRGRGNLYTAARGFATREAAERHIKREQEAITARHGGCIATVKEYKLGDAYVH